MTRDQLKKIIKECLVEILAEGLATPMLEHATRGQTPLKPQPVSMRRSNAADNIRYQPVPKPATINDLVRATTRDPVLASILADTAKTTMLEQAEGRQPALPAGGDQASRVAAAYDPGALIGGLTGQSDAQMHARWAQAAFAPARHLPGMTSGPMLQDFDPYTPVPSGK